MQECVDKDELFQIKDDLEIACAELFRYIDSLDRSTPFAGISVNKEKLNRLARKVSEEANFIIKLKKRP